MKNTVLFATVIEAISKMDDVQMSTMLGYANMVLGKQAKTKAKSTEESRLNAKDVDVKFALNKNALTIDGYIAKDAYGVIKTELEQMNVAFVKGTGFVFKTAKAAKEYAAKRTAVTAKERNTYRKDVYGWA